MYFDEGLMWDLKVEQDTLKKQEEIDKQNTKDDALVVKLMDAIDKKYGDAFKKLMSTPDLDKIIKESK